MDRGKRLVKIRVHLLGQTRILKLNYQLLDDEGKPMAPADQWLEDQTDEWLTAWTPDFTDELLGRMDRETALDSDGPDAPESIPPEGYYGERKDGPLPETRVDPADPEA